MDREERIEFLLGHYEHPYRFGPLSGATITAQGGNPGCGDAITVYLVVGDDDRISQLSFEGHGCTISMAGASVMTECFEGATLDQAEAMPADAVLQLLGPEVVGSRIQCANLGSRTLLKAITELRQERAMAGGRSSGGAPLAE